MENLRVGTICITYPRGDAYDGHVCISVEDAISSIEFISIFVPFAEFTKALSTMNSDCKYELSGLENVGKKCEYKTEIIPRYRGDYNDDEAKKKHIEKYEQDGWKGSLYDLMNHHHFVENDFVKVGFVRWVVDESKENNP